MLFILLASVLTALIIPDELEAAQLEGNYVSWCIADVTGDKAEEIILLEGDGDADGLIYGGALKIYELNSHINFVERKEHITEHNFTVERNIYYPIIGENAILILDMDLSALKPLMVQSGDIDGDGRTEISLCVYKTAKFHPVMAKRPFFYRYVDGGIEPVWLGSRLSRPFEDYILKDVNEDGRDEIISIELLENGDRVVCAYYWKGFGFELFLESEPFKSELEFIFKTDTEYGSEIAPDESLYVTVRDAEGIYFMYPDLQTSGFIIGEY